MSHSKDLKRRDEKTPRCTDKNRDATYEANALFRSRSRASLFTIAGIGILGACAAAFFGRPSHVSWGRGARPFIELHVPHVESSRGKNVLESDVGRTGVFKDATGREMVPFSEARIRWGDGTLYFWLYAGDLDLEGSITEADGPVLRDDAFHVEIQGDDKVYAIDVSVLGTVADARCREPLLGYVGTRGCDSRFESHAVVSVERDGTVNKLGDDDEEWVVEMAIPMAAVGLSNARAGSRIPLAIRRCDVGSGPSVCGGFGSVDSPAELVLEASSVATEAASRR